MSKSIQEGAARVVAPTMAIRAARNIERRESREARRRYDAERLAARFVEAVLFLRDGDRNFWGESPEGLVRFTDEVASFLYDTVSRLVKAGVTSEIYKVQADASADPENRSLEMAWAMFKIQNALREEGIAASKDGLARKRAGQANSANSAKRRAARTGWQEAKNGHTHAY